MSLTQSTTSLTPKKPGKPPESEKGDELPFLDSNFYIWIGDEEVASFQTITGMTVSRGVEPLVEGGKNDHTYEFPTGISYSQITLQKGMTSSEYFWKWMNTGQFGGWVEVKDFDLVQKNPSGTVERTWNFFNAFPVKWELGELTSVVNKSTITFERLVLSFDYFELAS